MSSVHGELANKSKHLALLDRTNPVHSVLFYFLPSSANDKLLSDVEMSNRTREYSLSPFLPRPRCRVVLHVSKYFSKKIIIFGSRCDNSVQLLRGAGRGHQSTSASLPGPRLSLVRVGTGDIPCNRHRPRPAGSELTRTSSDFLVKIIRMKANIYNANNGNI